MPKLRLNIYYNIGYQVLSLIVPLATAPYISRVLGKDGMGVYSYTFSIAHYFVLFCMLGVLNYGNREISMVNGNRKEYSAKFWQIYSIQLLVGIIALIVYIGFVFFYVNDHQTIYYLQAFYIVSGVLDISWFYFGIEHFKITTIVSAVNKILTAVLIFLFVKSFQHVWVYTAILAVGALMNNIVYWILLKHYVNKPHLTYQTIISHLSPLLILFIPVIAINIYKYIDKIMLGAMLGYGEVGLFEAAEKITNIPMGVISAIGIVMLPRISNLTSNNDVKSIKHYNNLSFNLVMLLAYGMVWGIMGIADVFVPFFYGREFETASSVLVWLSPSMIFVSWANVIRTQFLLPRKKDTLFCMSVVFGALVNVISNIILIPKLGTIGAAISTTIAEMIVCVCQSSIANKDMHLWKSLLDTIPYLLIGAVMYVIITQVEYENQSVCVAARVIIGVIIYFVLSYFFVQKRVNLSSLIRCNYAEK